MSAFILYAVHTLLAVVLVAGCFVSARPRRFVLVGCATTGVAAGVALAALGSSGSTWRSIALSSPRAALSGVAVACAWLLVGVLLRDRSPAAGALVGVASSALIAATLNEWIVPALLFWLVSSVALMAFVGHDVMRPGALFALVVSDLGLAGAFVLYALEAGVWTMPSSLPPLAIALALGSLVVRAGALPRVGVWETLGTPAAPALPLLLGGPLALLGVPLAGGGPWLAAGALVVAVACCLGALVVARISLSLVGAWPVWLSLGLLLAAPEALESASIAALLSITVVALWPVTHGLSRAERGMLVGWLPATAGFVAVMRVALLAFEEVARASRVADSAPWSVIAALLPVVVAAGVALGARIARQTSPGSSDGVGTACVWALFASGLLFGTVPASSAFARGALGAAGPVLALQVTALAVGVGVAVAAYLRPMATSTPIENVVAEVGTLTYSEDREDTVVLLGISAVIALGTVAAVAYLALEGLRYGFLPGNL